MKVTEGGNLKHRQLCFKDYLQRSSAEQREYAEVCVPPRMTKTDNTNTDEQTEKLLEEILSAENLNRAYYRVKGNKGAGGIDGMQVDELLPYLKGHKDELLQALWDGKYRPKPVRRVEIPKENGKMRKLGIPTVVDRLIQQAITQVLSPIFERQFSDNSYGFRPQRSAHDALRACQRHITEGFVYVVDMDLEKYFDTVNQSKLIQILSDTIKDGRVISLIHKFLRAGIMVDGLFEESPEGVPQGGPLSPLLGNVMLNVCDHELEKRGHRFVRYADDMMIFCKSEKAARRTLDHIVPYIEGKLFLRVNKEKTSVAHVRKVKYLGYGFYIHKGRGRLRIHPKSILKLKDKIRKVTGRSNGMGIEERKAKLNYIIRGWTNYFKLADAKALLGKMDEWLRSRIRMVTWKRWKRVRTRYANLQKLGIKKEQAWMWANTRKGYWRVAHSHILTMSLSNKRIERAGYPSFSQCYSAK
ncbi:Reverse transcriptase (RNA-dependent DNA polymerase) [Acididesulfobacillus acetoxydans]|uniref:Reverse transcriptase (RNA-dependent DNA polymerase) n=8 Tax=Acididesulfobacillus acetoxydans TaxID=1561005 RepID=A0A8S0WGG1_9FIRM|nr:group II intron reverse transcriptase/maturase [Acididesulfobacillus acetoxydans]CAA7599761.1 Reverse transcriptase (RNA-dependent DNA polymerase) [Acididesulfobacillus acetoxydans]CAA7600850.1 Reverse transcriptase (RNA-dependent DNA polymerase) [Acididesulfobacillus acetoxydans]CAA7601271.1 Reverse transcriptase (RNA-dependent DNA polymerase) [Acididesulfobacillus acetoxydans]CAA7601651.1 Reverse transcriptase (RNA-dependent DNA polymerase) [Acididesulfobacillus acetoxydans]CAA7601862.1 R